MGKNITSAVAHEEDETCDPIGVHHHQGVHHQGVQALLQLAHLPLSQEMRASLLLVAQPGESPSSYYPRQRRVQQVARRVVLRERRVQQAARQVGLRVLQQRLGWVQ